MPSRNRLLVALSDTAYRSLAEAAEPVQLALKRTLLEAGRAVTHVYFPTSGVVSVVSEPDPGEIVEVATIGREGMVGLPLVLGDETPSNRAFVQVPGEGFRFEAARFKRLIEDHPPFRAVLMRYAAALLNQIAQNVSCNRLHEVQERCARWLLQTHDRVEDDSFPLTHEFLGQMLGVHRPTVTIAAGMLQKAGLIRYARGIVTIIDRPGLEAASCSCYRIITREYDRLLPVENQERAEPPPALKSV